MSTVTCGCIAAIYLVGAPAINSSGQVWNTDDFWYCDGMQVGGAWCQEFDIMEANQYAFHSTVHTCDNPNSLRYISKCDTSGRCTEQAYDHPGNYGPGNSNVINSLKPYNVEIFFHPVAGS